MHARVLCQMHSGFDDIKALLFEELLIFNVLD